MWRKSISIVAVLALLLQTACSGSRAVSVDDPQPQTSVRITLKDGSVKEGIIIKKENKQLYYVDAASHKTEQVKVSAIREMSESDQVYDFAGNPIPDSEISAHKSLTKTLLYGAGGLILGVAAGIGAGLVIVSSDTTQSVAANAAIGVLGVAGAWYFGSIGADQDYEDAVFKARKDRYLIEKKQMEQEKKKLEELKKEKERLLKKKMQKEGKK